MTRRKCLHYYLLAPANGSDEIRGECKHCGKIKIHRPEIQIARAYAGRGLIMEDAPRTHARKHVPAANSAQQTDREYTGETT